MGGWGDLRRGDRLKTRVLAQIKGMELQGNQEPVLGLPLGSAGSSSVA